MRLGMAAAIARAVDGKSGDAAEALGARAWDWAVSNAPVVGKVAGMVAGSQVGASGIGGTIGEQAGRAMRDWWKNSSSTAFQRALGKAVGALTARGGGEENAEGNNPQSGKCILLIDDLDRCRPTFALKLLERVLHVFPVRGLAVLVVSDRAALEGAASREYGTPSGLYYMDKFFRACFAFQPVDRERAFGAWFEDHALTDAGVRACQERLGRFFGSVAHARSLTLRQMNDAAEHAYRWGDWGVLDAYNWVVLASVWVMRTYPEGQACIDAMRRGESSCEDVLTCLGSADDSVREQWEKAFEDREALKDMLNGAFRMDAGGARM